MSLWSDYQQYKMSQYGYQLLGKMMECENSVFHKPQEKEGKCSPDNSIPMALTRLIIITMSQKPLAPPKQQTKSSPYQHHLSHSKTSTSSSPDSLPSNPEDTKAKAQLCRRFMQLGSCPYQRRCKFAHGSHELLTNHQRNVKYKTKHCGNFDTNLACIYGQRCNFIHARLPPTPRRPQDAQLALARSEGRGRSRLLALLGVSP